MPLISDRDEWRIVPAHSQVDDLDGLLIFEDKRVILFLFSEEALTIGALVLHQLPTLLHQCAPDYLADHANEVERLRTAWWHEEAIRTRIAAGLANADAGAPHAD